jgi:hypothetical protein
MKGISKLTAIVYQDKGLMRLLSGLVASGVGLLSIAVTAFVWYF